MTKGERISRAQRAASGVVWNEDGSCLVDDCGKLAKHLGLCGSHYHRRRRHGDPLGGGAPKGLKLECSVDDCAEQVRARGLCRRHCNAWWKAQRAICSVADCEKQANSFGLCPRHYQRQHKYGDPLAGPAFRRSRGEGLPRWAYWQRRDDQRLVADGALHEYVEILRGDPCSYCGNAPCEHIDHIIPVNEGGQLVAGNVTAACASCNHRKGTSSLLTFLLWRNPRKEVMPLYG